MGGDATRSMESPLELETGNSLQGGSLAGEYEILGKLAAGSYGAVYAAEHRVLHRRAAIKVLHHVTPDAVHRFTREARSVNVIKHPSIVDVYEYGQLPDGRPYYVMEFLEGVTLDAILGERGKLTPRESFELLEPICSALAAAHDAGVVHRDIKPSNIFVAKTGVKLLDFGIAKLLQPQAGEPELTSTNHRIGTPLVMAPEQILNGVVDPRTDIYSMGVVLYRALTGEYPFGGDLHAVHAQHLTSAPPVPSKVAPQSPEIDELLLRCLAKDPAERFPSMAAFRDAFRHAALSCDGSSVSGSSPVAPVGLASEPLRATVQATPNGEGARAIRRAPVQVRRWWRFAIGALVGLVGLGGVALALRHVPSKTTSQPSFIEMKAQPATPTAQLGLDGNPAPAPASASEPIVKAEKTPPPSRSDASRLKRHAVTDHAKRATTTVPASGSTSPAETKSAEERPPESPPKPPVQRASESPFLPQRVGGDSPFLPVRPTDH